MSEVERDCVERVLEHSRSSRFIRDLGIELTDVGAGWAVSDLLPGDRHGQSDGFAHAAVVTAILDHTAGMAMLTQLDDDKSVVTAELKVNFLRPIRGVAVRCRAEVLHVGARLGLAEARLWLGDDEEPPRLSAAALITLAPIDRVTS